jgi:hypothetical protein
MRRELVHRFLEEQEWDSEHFRRAAKQPSFLSDIAQLMETATWQDISFEKTPELIAVAELVVFVGHEAGCGGELVATTAFELDVLRQALVAEIRVDPDTATRTS